MRHTGGISMIYLKSRHLRKILVIIIGAGLIIGGFVFLVKKELLLSEAVSALFGLLVGLLLYEISLFVDEIAENKKTSENTKHVYELYKIEIENNVNHLNNMISKRWVPFYRLQTNARDKLWGELADYSKDINFMKKINALYNEYELINNKIEIMNSVRLQLAIRPYEEMSGQIVPEDVKKLNSELGSQLEGCIGLGEGANRIANDCLKFISDEISR
ncbi:MAG: hypothetical protein NTY47_02745 [Candidatus Omnitrophica bacterium]|nr:hypothetical protein [Candidatus Omnitrophota bacterium]